MANFSNVKDIYQIVNSLKDQTLGTEAETVVDTSSFVTVGEKMVRESKDNLMNAITQLFGRTIFASRPYTGRFRSIDADDMTWGGMLRKISYLQTDAQASGDWNTDINPSQLANGESIDMYKINKPKPVQLVFPGMTTTEFEVTRFENQMLQAFRNESEFGSFYDGGLVEFNNDIEQSNELKRQSVVLNMIAGQIALNREVNLTEAFNARYKTTYTAEQLLSEHLSEFMGFMVATIKLYSERMENRTTIYHVNPTQIGNIPRHTPKSRQRMIMNSELFRFAEASVFSTIFNPKYLNIGDFEAVTHWQTLETPTSINVKPNIIDLATGNSKDAEEAVTESRVIGVLFDRDAMAVNRRFEGSYATPFNARGRYWNLFIHQCESFYNDYTENCIVFIM